VTGDPAVHFVLGTGRCGSTLVHEVLSQHAGIGFLSNIEDRLPMLDFAARWNGPLYRRLPPSVTTKGRLRFAPSEGYDAFDREVAPIISTPSRDLVASDVTPWLARRFERFFTRRAAVQGAPVYLHKFTGWPRAGFVHEILPHARFVHVVRDGRAVVNSWLQMPWWLGYRGPEQWHFGQLSNAELEEWEGSGRSFVVLAGLAWQRLIDAFTEARSRLPEDHWLDVRYEDFVASPAEVSARILDFIGVGGDPGFERRLARYRLDASRADAYRRDLDVAGLRRLDALLAPGLARFGYPT
jgi:hypothetical protein